MFVRSNNNLPADPAYPASSFKDLGYKINDQNQIVSIKSPPSFFPYYITNNERANDVHKEAMHKCARKAVNQELSNWGVREVYLSGEMGKDITETKPVDKPFTRILATDLSVLKAKGDVIVIVGEHSQDIGIWAYRSLMHEGGINGASAVGLVKKIANFDFNCMPKDTPCDHSDHPSGIPGLILLNPGQRLYSHDCNDIMTHHTWQARPRSSAIAAPFVVDETHNKVPGHSTAEAHVTTVLDSIIPKLVDLRTTRLWIVAIADAAENLITYLDSKNISHSNTTLIDAIKGMAFMEPQHNLSQIKSPLTKSALANLSIAYVKSASKPKGERIHYDKPEKENKGSSGESSSEPTARLKRTNTIAKALSFLVSEEPEMGVFSAGVVDDELIWPAVVDDVLEFFVGRAADDNARKEVMENIDMMGR